MRLLFVASAVGPLGTGIAGGVELNLLNLAHALQARGHVVHIVAPAGSRTGEIPLVWQAQGLPPAFAQGETRDSPVILPQPSVLANLWEGARALQNDYDLIVNWGYDWLPLYLTRFFQTPVLHVISMGSLLDHIDSAIAQVLSDCPGTVAVHSQAQAETFVGIENLVILPCGMDLSAYTFCSKPENYLVWIGRIAPEKGLEDALAAAALAKLPLYVLGRLQDPGYFAQIQADNPGAILKYCGFLPTDEMQSVVGKAKALLVTPKWIEAFGNVVVEALACGVPVIAYRRGGPAETVLDAITGFLTPPDDPSALVAAIAKLDTIDRARCRAHAEENYTLSVMTDRFETWFRKLDKSQKPI
ncbi:MAG: glycosyltransferase family 4 protein [Anaerolineae bacterium]|nr:glycosyltransferase family 4 protein [Gloeobacterales cyanobacterium ES-bin-313]